MTDPDTTASADTDIEKIVSTWHYQVTFSDCDPAALAYYPRIIEWCDWANEHMWRSVGFAWHDFFGTEGMNGMPLLNVDISFHFPMRHGDRLTFKTWLDRVEGRTFTIGHEIYNGEHLSAKSEEKRAWVVLAPDRPKGLKAIPMPEEVVALFRRPKVGT